MQNWKISVEAGSRVPFHNNVDFCVGTGRMGLALQEEYQQQLALVQEWIGFKHIRGHGLFSDDMAIYRVHKDEDGTEEVEYCFTYLDLVMDRYLKLGLEPFLELGFMPKELASGDQTVFYWKGQVTPPKSYEGWCDLVTATLSHLMERYGADRVVTWPVEVWNEPNLPGFWKDADQQEYFKLFKTTFQAIKALDARFRVGGPAVCGGSDVPWITAFTECCEKEGLKIDFVSRHHYTTELPKREGHYGYPALQDPFMGFDNLQSTRDIVDSHDCYKGLPIHITEFNTSYVPNAPLHDTNRNAAFLSHQLSRLGDFAESYSYWTFGDIFEEFGVPFTPFHGGFGLVANGCIPKPTMWSFAFFKELMGGEAIYRDDHSVFVQMPDGKVRGVLWNYERAGEAEEAEIQVELPLASKGSLGALTFKTVDEETCNPLKLWHDLGEPAHLMPEDLKLLKTAAQPLVSSERVDVKDGKVLFNLKLKSNAVVAVELRAIEDKSDRGYDYERVMAAEPIEDGKD